MPETKTEPKVIRTKTVEVTVIKQSGEVSFVTYYDKTRGPLRVTIPTSTIEAGKAPLDELEIGVPAPGDIDWSKVKVKALTSAELEKAMRDNGIFTKTDLAAQRTAALIVINRLTGLLLQDIIEQI